MEPFRSLSCRVIILSIFLIFAITAASTLPRCQNKIAPYSPYTLSLLPHLQSIKKGSQEVPVRAADNDLVTDHNVLGQDLKLLIAKDLQEKYTHYNLVTDHNVLSWDLKLLIAKI